MGFNNRLDPARARMTIGSVATDGSTIQPIFSAAMGGQILGARFVNSGASTVASGTTAGSALNVYVYKTASSTDSQVASAALGAVATFATAGLTMSTSTALTRFAEGAVYLGEVRGGAGADHDNSGAIVEVSYMYGHARPDTATP